MENQPNSGYQFREVLLIKSDFERLVQIIVPPDQTALVKQDLNIDLQVAVQNEIIQVIETARLNVVFEELLLASFEIQYIGLFEKIGEPSLDSETFGRINAAAIIFPFVREQIASLALKAGLGTLLLPPINFVEKANSGK
jgi:preprotein translocase subunit SecB